MPTFMSGRSSGLVKAPAPLRIETVAKRSRVKRTKSKRTKLKRDAVSPFRGKVWTLAKNHARGMDGADVVLALRQAGEEIWAVGIDETYSNMAHQDDEVLGNAFDITWLTIVCVKLLQIKQGHRPKVRVHRDKDQRKSP